MQLLEGNAAEEHDALHLSAARDGDVGQQDVAVGMTRVLDGRHRAGIKLTICEEAVQGAWGRAFEAPSPLFLQWVGEGKDVDVVDETEAQRHTAANAR